jgi:hypothetical protein
MTQAATAPTSGRSAPAGRTLGPSPSAASGLRPVRAGADTSPKAVAVSRQERRRTPQAATAADHHPCPDPPHRPARHPPHVATPADSGGDTLAIGWNSWPYASALERRATRKPAPPRGGRLEPARAAVSMPSGTCRVRLRGARGWPAGRPDGPRPDRAAANSDPTREAAPSRHEPKRAIKPRYTTHPRADNRTARAPTDARPRPALHPTYHLSPARPTTQPSPSPRAHPPAPPT